MSIVICGVVPHPPIAVPEVGKEEANQVSNTQRAFLKLAEQIKASGAETMVIISPHSPLFSDAIVVNMAPRLKGGLAKFGAPQVTFDYSNNAQLVREIINQCGKLNLVAAELDQLLAKEFQVDLALDHGVTVPLYFMRQAGLELPLVVTSMAMFSFEQLYRFGIAVDKAAEVNKQKVALIASADLSHRLKPGAPAGYEPSAAEFDRELVQLVASADAAGLVQMDYERAERAGECGLRSIIMMMGALEGKAVDSEVLCYEGPFGVGYMVARLTPGAPDASRAILGQVGKQRAERLKARLNAESFIVKVARETLEHYVLGKSAPTYGDQEIPAEFKGKGATFVTIKKHGHLRGCIGSVFPQKDNIVAEVQQNAISAGIHDPRFYPVEPDELEELTYSVDVLTAPEPVASIEELDPKRYGVIVRKDHRSGLLLPDLEGINTAEHQVSIAKEKAGIGADEQVTLERFEVVRYK
ncbi:AmmeMemoRadiSam system protein A [Peptococcaceae bacterium 1198_IL3148]